MEIEGFKLQPALGVHGEEDDSLRGWAAGTLGRVQLESRVGLTPGEGKRSIDLGRLPRMNKPS